MKNNYTINLLSQGLPSMRKDIRSYLYQAVNYDARAEEEKGETVVKYMWISKAHSDKAKEYRARAKTIQDNIDEIERAIILLDG